MRKSILFGSFLAGFLLILVPSISAIEYNQVEEIQETTIYQYIHEIKQKINSSDFKKQIPNLKESLTNIQIPELKDKIISSLESSRDYRILGDPGNGTDHNGPDDWTDWIYGIISLMFTPIIIMNLLIIAIVLLNIAYPLPILMAILNFIGPYIVPILNYPWPFVYEFLDLEDIDGDGR